MRRKHWCRRFRINSASGILKAYSSSPSPRRDAVDLPFPQTMRRASRRKAQNATSNSGVPRTNQMQKTLAAVDELTGLVSAVALVRPSKNIADVTIKSVKNKWKDKAFAAGVNRREIEQCAADLGVPLEEHIGVVLAAMQANASELGLDGIKS